VGGPHGTAAETIMNDGGQGVFGQVDYAVADAPSQAARHVARPLLFLRSWLAHPLRMGSVIPSSDALCRRVVRRAWPAPGRAVLELGSGTGVLARAFLAAGLNQERLILVEIDPSLAAHLRREFPAATVIEGDARELASLVPERWLGRIGSVVCGIPLVLLPTAEQRRFIDAMTAVAPGRGFLHYSYCITSPLPARRHGLTARREAWTPLNLPPASVWRYQSAR
jgi:phosphatidylethanolamine/phosphatidyl-N-methylethanolamine N-methyltransferase